MFQIPKNVKSKFCLQNLHIYTGAFICALYTCVYLHTWKYMYGIAFIHSMYLLLFNVQFFSYFQDTYTKMYVNAFTCDIYIHVYTCKLDSLDLLFKLIFCFYLMFNLFGLINCFPKVVKCFNVAFQSVFILSMISPQQLTDINFNLLFPL